MKRGSFLKSLGALIVGVPLAQKIEISEGLPKDKEGFYLEDTGITKIGTTTPNTKLHVYNANGNVGIGMPLSTAMSGYTEWYYNPVTKKIEKV